MTKPASPWQQRFDVFLRKIKRPGASAFLSALPPDYPDRTPAGLAMRDMLRLQALSPEAPKASDLWHDPQEPRKTRVRLQIYSLEALDLDQVMPFLQNLDLKVLDQMAYSLPMGGRTNHVRSFSVELPQPSEAKGRLKTLLLDTLNALLEGRAENDALNALTLRAGLAWQDIDVLRAYRNHYFQWNPRCTPERFHLALLREPTLTRLLLGYFEARFRPDPRLPSAASREEETLPAIRQEIAGALASVTDAGTDRILRDLFNLMDASLRTNHYQQRSRPDRFIAIKIDSMGVFSMPSAKPRYEIYVHAPHMEGIHLRASKVARGGIRWSDRPEDFREEILGLMQTQVIKNALIVPHGAKGGFIVKNPVPGREAARERARNAYRTLIQGLLELTDNRTPAGVIRHPGVIAYDDDDPYLVVAADKGTARFSDLANGVAAEYGFWLGDAFASGGSHGYDHKDLGITARGAWECVKLHFAEMGQDPQREALTVIGVGSMDGDVFGNGMLQSRTIRLLGAFGSRHIFLDPHPDPERSFRERQRLFAGESGAWSDYDPDLISPGGGVFARDAHDIPLTPDVRRWLGVRRASVDGEELVRLLLTAPVDLLWLGGVGTYVKGSGEKHEDVGDRANDPVRVDATQVRAKVVGEGANLGFTQQGRVEYALAGGCLNNDAVDNSAGVDLSDHEVNLKILMAQQPRARDAGDERDLWLTRVRDEVCQSVLAHNREQCLSISLDMQRSLRDPEPFLETADELARAGFLDRRSSFFPGRREIAAREGRHLTRPDLAVLMPCSKLALKQALLDHQSFLTPWTHDDLYRDYFPEAMRERFHDQLPRHPLAPEIAAAQIANWVIGRAGSAFPAWCHGTDSESLLLGVAAYLAFDRGYGFEPIRRKLRNEAVGTRPEARHSLLIRIEEVVALTFQWFKRRAPAAIWEPELAGRWQSGVSDFMEFLRPESNRHAPMPSAQADPSLDDLSLTPHEARLIAALPALNDLPALMELSTEAGSSMARAAPLYFRTAAELGIDRLLSQLEVKTHGDLWEHRARSAAAFRLRANLMRLCRQRLGHDAANPDGNRTSPTRDASLERFRARCRELLAHRAVPLYGICALALELEDLMDDGQRA